jgi:hypothetical protein
MAVQFVGSTVTPQIGCDPVSGQYVFALVNTIRSLRKVNILRFVAVGDSLEVSTTAGHIMPLLKTWRCSCSAISGGVSIDKRPPWDTAVNNPDPNVKLLYSGYGVSEANRIAVSARIGPAWQQYTQRRATAVRQVRSLDASMLSRITSVEDFILFPGQALVVSWEHGVQPVGGSIIFNIAWEEDEYDTGYDISGAVTLDSVAVSGAKVLVVTDTDRDLPSPELEVITTGAPGTWTKKLASGIKASVFVQARDGETLYTDEGKPYLKKP